MHNMERQRLERLRKWGSGPWMTDTTDHFKIIDKTEKYTYVQKHYIKSPPLCAYFSELLPFTFLLSPLTFLVLSPAQCRRFLRN